MGSALAARLFSKELFSHLVGWFIENIIHSATTVCMLWHVLLQKNLPLCCLVLGIFFKKNAESSSLKPHWLF